MVGWESSPRFFFFFFFFLSFFQGDSKITGIIWSVLHMSSRREATTKHSEASWYDRCVSVKSRDDREQLFRFEQASKCGDRRSPSMCPSSKHNVDFLFFIVMAGE